MKAIIQVALKKTVLDPQGRAITQALRSHGHEEVVDVRQGKFFEVELAPDASPDEAQARMERLAEGVLANPVIEEYKVTVVD